MLEFGLVVLLRNPLGSVDLVADPGVLLHDACQVRFLLSKPVLCLRELLGQGVYFFRPMFAWRRPIEGMSFEMGERFNQVGALSVFFVDRNSESFQFSISLIHCCLKLLHLGGAMRVSIVDVGLNFLRGGRVSLVVVRILMVHFPGGFRNYYNRFCIRGN